MLNGPDEGLLEIPSGYKVPDLSEEQLQKKQQRAKKRREQAQEKREKDKVRVRNYDRRPGKR